MKMKTTKQSERIKKSILTLALVLIGQMAITPVAFGKDLTVLASAPRQAEGVTSEKDAVVEIPGQEINTQIYASF